MTNGTRGSVLALFFVLGMGFMGAMFLFGRPDWDWHERVRVVEEPTKTKLVSYTRTETKTRVVPVETRPVSTTAKSILSNPTPANELPKEIPLPEKADVAESEATPPSEAMRIRNQVMDRYRFFRTSRRYLPVSTIDLSGGVALRGQVFLDGTPPPAQTAPVDKICSQWLGETVKSQAYVVGGNGELKDVVVTVNNEKFDLQWPIPEEPHVIIAEKCQYEPYVSVMRIGQPLIFDNRDEHMHLAHTMPRAGGGLTSSAMAALGNSSVEIPLRASAELKEEPFVTIKCDVHSWEYAYVTVVAHPYFAVTDADGKYEIKGLPPGKYSVRAHHRRAGLIEKEATVGETGGEVDFQFEVRKK
jgi:hypothetical protein